ncbi:MAG: hypothetical protein U0163_06050 [Gemmatimonadaceae bacterium]
MISVFYVHWNEEEARERETLLRKAGLRVRSHWKSGEVPRFRDNVPDVFVISLDRLPSHGRAIAEWVWSAKSRHNIPIVFSGGAAEKVRETRTAFPGAHYCATGQEAATVARLFG